MNNGLNYGQFILWSRMSSISAHLLNGITVFCYGHNKANRRLRGKIIAAEVGYVLMVPFSLIELALSKIAQVFSRHSPLSAESKNKVEVWSKSCRGSLYWASGNALAGIYNLFAVKRFAYKGGYIDLQGHLQYLESSD